MGQSRPKRKGAGPQRSVLGFPSVYAYERPNWGVGEVRDFRGSATPLHIAIMRRAFCQR